MNNYINTLRTGSGFNPEDIEDVVEVLIDMDFKKFYETFKKEGGTFEHLYPDKPGTPQYQANVELLKTIWIPNYKEQIK